MKRINRDGQDAQDKSKTYSGSQLDANTGQYRQRFRAGRIAGGTRPLPQAVLTCCFAAVVALN
jgi:hypothetical protein